MPTICMHCISNTNSTNFINLILDMIHTPHNTQVGDIVYRHSFWQVVLVVEDIITFHQSELPIGYDGQLFRKL